MTSLIDYVTNYQPPAPAYHKTDHRQSTVNELAQWLAARRRLLPDIKTEAELVSYCAAWCASPGKRAVAPLLWSQFTKQRRRHR